MLISCLMMILMMMMLWDTRHHKAAIWREEMREGKTIAWKNTYFLPATGHLNTIAWN